MKRLIPFVLAMFPVLSAARSGQYDNTPITSFDLSRYLGTGYEIARFDHSFERGMQGVTANYSLQNDGTVLVVNSGLRGGKPTEAVGRAKTTSQVGRLRVSFFWIFYSDYNILEMDKDGQWVLVGSRSPQYLWILARTPKLSDDVMTQIINLAEQRGYNTDNLIFVEH